MSEAKITSKVKALLQGYSKKHKPYIFFWKVSDRYTSGIPDYYILIKGTPIHLELKDINKEPSSIQRYMMKRIRQAGGISFSSCDFDEIKMFLDKILIDKGLI